MTLRYGDALKVGLTARCDRHVDEADMFIVVCCCQECRRRSRKRADEELDRQRTETERDDYERGYVMARRIFHALGVSWRDPRTGVVYPAPARGE
jgi:hypothetical protein